MGSREMPSMNTPKKAKAQDMAPIDAKSPKMTQNCHGKEEACACGMDNRATESRAHKKSQGLQSATHTKVVIKFNCGFSNNLYIRGEGVTGLSWEKGTPMKCTKADEWVWETDNSFNNKAQIKVLINDKQYELGENHTIDCGKSFTFSPSF